ncbi:hypothetical protein D3C72_731170 [compost metagenome]
MSERRAADIKTIIFPAQRHVQLHAIRFLRIRRDIPWLIDVGLQVRGFKVFPDFTAVVGSKFRQIQLALGTRQVKVVAVQIA